MHDTSSGYMAGQLLIAMPQMRDPRFQRNRGHRRDDGIGRHHEAGAVEISEQAGELIEHLNIRRACPDERFIRVVRRMGLHDE